MSKCEESNCERAGPQVKITHFVDITQLVTVQPDIKTLSVISQGNVIEWPAKFRRAMREVCKDRALRAPIPPQLLAAAIPSRGILLLWPGTGAGEHGFPVRQSPAGRRVTTDLTAAYAALHIDLPNEIVIEIPATRYLHPVYGETLALHFHGAEFLPEKSRTAAALIDEE